MKLWNRYHMPSTVDEALGLLAKYAGQARVVAGGTDLLIDMRAGHHPPQEALIDVTAIPELGVIEQHDGHLVVGASVTHAQITQSPLLLDHARCLAESCGVVGGPQVRNVGTIGGNVAHALPAGDGTTSLVVLEAEVEVVLDGERRWVPILDMFKGPGQSLLDPTRDLLLRFRFPVSTRREATAFSRIMRPQGVALPILGCAVWVHLDESATHIERARVCIAPTGPTPRRIAEVEDALVDAPATEDTVNCAVGVALEAVKARTSKYRATAEYRHEMTAVLLHRTLPLAVERARR